MNRPKTTVRKGRGGGTLPQLQILDSLRSSLATIERAGPGGGIASMGGKEIVQPSQCEETQPQDPLDEIPIPQPLPRVLTVIEQYRRGLIPSQRLLDISIDLAMHALDPLNLDDFLAHPPLLFSTPIREMLRCDIGDIIPRAIELINPLDTKPRGHHPGSASPYIHQANIIPQINIENSFLKHAISVFTQGLCTQDANVFCEQFKPSLSTRRKDAGPKDNIDIKTVIYHSIYFHYACLIEETLFLPMETMRWILSAKFPDIEKDLYQYYPNISPTGDIGPTILRGASTQDTLQNSIPNEEYLPSNHSIKSPRRPRFSRIDLTILILATYGCPAIATPLGVSIETKLLDRTGRFARFRIKHHAHNMSQLGVMSWYYSTITNDSLIHDYKRLTDSTQDDLFSDLAIDHEHTLLQTFLTYFGYRDLLGDNNSEEILAAATSFTCDIDIYTKFQSGCQHDGRPSFFPPDKIIHDHPLSGVFPPCTNHFLFTKSHIFPTKRKGKGKVAYPSTPPVDFMCYGYMTLSDDPSKTLFYQSIVCSAIYHGSVLVYPRSSRDVSLAIQSFKKQFAIVAQNQKKPKGPVCLLLGNIYNKQDDDEMIHGSWGAKVSANQKKLSPRTSPDYPSPLLSQNPPSPKRRRITIPVTRGLLDID